METILRLEDKEYKAVYKGITPRIYREYFGRDLMLDISNIQQKFNDRVKSNVKENKTEDAYFVLLDVGGSLFYERLVWTCIKAAKELDKEKFIPFNDFMDTIDDYDTYIAVGFILLEQIIFANKPTVEDENTEKEEDSSKKKE